MTRDALADAFDKAAEALAQVAHELRGSEQPQAASSLPAERQQAAGGPSPAAPPPAPLPPKRTAPDDSAFTECPAHHKPWVDGRYGKYCQAQSDDFPNWANDKGYCKVTPRSAAAWLRQHPQAA